jgi:hypothetical protein
MAPSKHSCHHCHGEILSPLNKNKTFVSCSLTSTESLELTKTIFFLFRKKYLLFSLAISYSFLGFSRQNSFQGTFYNFFMDLTLNALTLFCLQVTILMVCLSFSYKNMQFKNRVSGEIAFLAFLKKYIPYLNFENILLYSSFFFFL